MTDDEILSAVKRASVIAARMPQDRFLRTFANFRIPRTRALWEGLVGIAHHDPEAWRAVSALPFRPAVLFFEPSHHVGAWLFEDCHAVARTLAELPAVGFYVTDEAATGIFAFNDHDVAIAVGTAAVAMPPSKS